MPVYIYRSTDASAPVLNGLAGSLIAVLDACLVNGYGGKAAVGWTKPFSGANLASYKSNAGSQLYFGIDDTGTTSARIRGFQTMTAAGVAAGSGTYPFPNDVQMSGGLYVPKSSAAVSAAKTWVLISNSKLVYFFNEYTVLDSNNQMIAFGDFSSYKTNDSNCSIIVSPNGASGNNNYLIMFSEVQISVVGHYLSQKFDGLSYSVPAGKIPICGWHANSYMGHFGNYLIQDPEPIVGGKMLTPIGISELSGSLGVPRGRLPGLWAPCHPTLCNTGDVISGAVGTDLEGRAFEAFKLFSGGVVGMCFIETTDTWDLINFK